MQYFHLLYSHSDIYHSFTLFIITLILLRVHLIQSVNVINMVC